ncbi:MAG: 3-oxoacyl-[acyl-carrier-protein] synthase III C-terminal domain-containing protein [Hymenobacter sp.]
MADELSYLIPHQANLRISANVVKQLGLDPARAVNNIERLGNTGCAGAAIGLAEIWDPAARPATSSLSPYSAAATPTAPCCWRSSQQ